MPVSRVSRMASLLVSIVLVTSCPKRPGGTALPKGETFRGAPVILVSVDTLRSDHLPFYGYTGVETPALSALRKDSVLFERAYAHVPLTLPSHASVLTGRRPSEHGIHDNLGYRIRREVPTLAELLGRAGYATGGAVSCYVLKADSGMARGFDLYDDQVDAPEGKAALGLVQRGGKETAKKLEAWMGAQTTRPVFAFLHLYEPHTPYEPPEPYKTRYAAVPYDGEIAVADEVVGSFLAFLKEKGIYDRALIVLFSDHGEGLGDHGEDEHGMFLYREAIQVPLLLKLPGGRRAGSSVATPVALSDVFTTVGRAVDLADFQAPEGTVSLLELSAGAKIPSRRLLSETFFPRIHFGWSELSSLIEGSWHYIEAPRPEIYDLATDPREKTNRIEERPDALRALRADLLGRKPSFEAPADVGAEDRKKLASLGYLSAGPSPAGTLEDPKDRIKTFEDLRKGLGEMTGGRPEKAVEIFDRLLAENPRMLDVWEMKSQSLIGLGRHEEALQALHKAVELAPEAARGPYVIEVANLCLQMGKWDEGLRNAEALRILGDPAAEDIAARAALGKGDLVAAETAARKSSEAGTGKSRIRGLLVLGRIAVMRNDLPAATAHAEKAKELSKGDERPQSGLHMLMGDVLARAGRAAEAERELLEELRLYPDRTDARLSLAALYAAVDRREDSRRVVIELVTRQPTPDAFLLGMKTFRSTEDAEGEKQLRLEAKRLFPKDRRFAGG